MALGLTGNIVPKGVLPDNNKLLDSKNIDFSEATSASTNGLATLPTSTTDSDGAYFAVSNSSSVQKKLTKGNISLAGFDNSSTGFTNSAGTVTSVGTGTGLSGAITASGTITLALNDIADMTETWDNAADEFIVLDAGVQKKKLSSEIFGSNAFNSTNFTQTKADFDLDHLFTLVGATADTSEDLGTFTGGTIGDNLTLTAALQALETGLELKAPASGPTFTGNVAIPNITDLESAVTANTNKATNVTTNLGITGTTEARTITSSDGTDAVIPVATDSVSGVMSAADHTLFSAIEAGATADQSAAEITALLNDVATYTLGDGSGTITVSGNLTVTGTTTTVNTEEILLADNQIVLNSNYTGTTPTNGGIELERGDYVNTSIFWDETENRWYGTRPNHNTPGSASGVITGIIPLIETAGSGTAGTANAQKLGSMFINTATSAIYIYA